MAVESVRSRLRFNNSAFQQLHEREAELLLAEEHACAALQSAQDALDAVRAELQDIRDRSAGVSSTINELRGYLSARLLRSFPTELLYKIFVDSVADAGACEWRPQWNSPRPPTDVMPFTLAAVCRRWRCEAVRMATLWSFIVVPSPIDRNPSNYLSIMLRRSQSTPLDIFIAWKPRVDPFPTARPRVLPTPVCKNVFDQLGSAVQRLRRMYCALPGECEAASAMFEFLQYPMPQLRELTIDAATFAWRHGRRPTDELLGRCLPHCPHLVKLYADVPHVLSADAQCPLTYLVLDHLALSGEAVWEVLRSCAATLEHLDVGLSQPDLGASPSPAPFTLALPALRTLITRSHTDKLFAAWSAALHAPHVEELEVQDGTSSVSEKVVAHFASSLRSLFYCTYASLSADDAAQLSVLGHLQSVCLFEPCDDFFEYLTENNAWPKLQTLSLFLGDADDDDYRALVDLARTRHASAEMATLTSVEFEDHCGPGWLADTLELYTAGTRLSPTSA